MFDVTPAPAPKFGAAIGAGVFGSVPGLGMIASGGITTAYGLLTDVGKVITFPGD